MQDTLTGMDLETKSGQLFCPIAPTDYLDVIGKTLDMVKPGGMMYRAFTGTTVQKNHRYLH